MLKNKYFILVIAKKNWATAHANISSPDTKQQRVASVCASCLTRPSVFSHGDGVADRVMLRRVEPAGGTSGGGRRVRISERWRKRVGGGRGVGGDIQKAAFGRKSLII